MTYYGFVSERVPRGQSMMPTYLVTYASNSGIFHSGAVADSLAALTEPDPYDGTVIIELNG